MGDTTPLVKPLGKLTSKYITPCRTFGLKRRNTPQSGNLKKVRSENDCSLTKMKSIEDSPISRNISTPRTCLSPINTENIVMKSEITPVKSFSNNSPISKLNPQTIQLTPVSRKSSLISLKTSKPETMSLATTFESKCFQLEEKKSLEDELTSCIKRVNCKASRLEKLKKEEIYTRKHNLLELQKSTDKWLSTFKEVAKSLHTELQTRGRPCTILDILVEHNIPPERVGLNAETLEFD